MSHPSPSAHGGSDVSEPSVTLFTNNWTHLRVAADYAGVERSELEAAVAAGEVRSLPSDPDLPGEQMVALADVEAWLRRRERTRAVLA
jgi:hypothetical protein